MKECLLLHHFSPPEFAFTKGLNNVDTGGKGAAVDSLLPIAIWMAVKKYRNFFPEGIINFYFPDSRLMTIKN